MKLEKLLERKVGPDFENIHIKVPKGTKALIEKKFGRQSITIITKQALYEKLK